MNKTKPQLFLASASPRRAELLTQVGVGFVQRAANIVEALKIDEGASEFVVRMAREKADVILQQLSNELPPSEFMASWVLASDTSIVLNGEVLGKPVDECHARAMWQAMSGKEHKVLTSLCLMSGEQCLERLSINTVMFTHLSDAQMAAYWQSGEPQDKAGAYAIQGKAALWIKEISGSYSSIMGLPLFDTGELLSAAGFELWP